VAKNFPQPELRRNPITGEWVIIAAGRGKRPHAPEPLEQKDQPDHECPFCPGRESETPPEVCAFRDSDESDCPGWSARTFPNRFPILVSAAPGSGTEPAISPDLRPAEGASEVIVDTPDHDKPPWAIGVDQTVAMLKMYQERIDALKQEGRTSYVHIIRNHMAGAASSLEHPHSQLFGLPFIPPTVDAELDGFAAATLGLPGCIMCDIIEREEQADERIVAANEDFIAFCPFASRLPYETWIVPRRHQVRFEDCAELESFAGIIVKVMGNFEARIGNPPFNYWIHTYPLHGETRPYHWHLEILPRLTVPGGLELGADVWVNVVTPEDAAASLR
jgi:UDPglucose--hexose-1-phosphate uridylyltransferase